jgi:predicted TIM-barrel fold metal-dependent hydrolase
VSTSTSQNAARDGLATLAAHWPPRVFDTHVHFPWGDDRDPEQATEELVSRCRALNIVRVALLGARWADYNDRVAAAVQRHPELFVGLYGVELERDTPESIRAAYDRGFRGLKIINALQNYDDQEYWPIYAEAERLGMVCLFHTGVVGGGVDFRETDPFDPEVVKRTRFWEKRAAGQGFSSAHMDPIFLDTIAFTFPRLRIIGAHLGVGQYDYACDIARWRRNVFWDLSGGELVRRRALERHLIGTEISPFKLTFGSDCEIERMADEIANWNGVFDLLRLSAEERDRVFYGTAARLFALDEFAGVTDEAAYDPIWNADEEEPVDPDAAGSELAPLEEEWSV